MPDFDHLKAGFAKGAISRRAFLDRSASIGVSAALANAFAASVAKAETPKRGGVLKAAIGRGSTADTLDPALYTDTYMMLVGYGLRNNLVEISPTDELVPELAESWESTNGQAKWVFNLRKSVEFHNGKTMTAEDVVASVRHHTKADSESAARGILSIIKDVKTDGKHSVIFELESGNADFAYLLSDYHVTIMPALEDGTPDWRSGVGTGGYVLERFEPGVRTTMSRNKNYFKSDRAYFDEAVILCVIDIAARTSALISGRVDVIDGVDLKTVDLLARDPRLTIEEVQGNQHYCYPMMVDREPFNDVNVRLALKYAIDREEILDKLLKGHGYLGNDHPIGRANRFYAENLPQRPYDLDKARFHLKKAGLSSLEATMHVSEQAFPGCVDGAVIFQESAKPAGINLTVRREPNDGFNANVWMVAPWSASYWSGRVTEDWMFSTTYAAGVPWNETHWNNERFNQLLVAARTEADVAKRRQMYEEMQRLCSDDCGALIPIFANFVFATSDKIAHGPEISGTWDLDGIKAIERWWAAG